MLDRFYALIHIKKKYMYINPIDFEGIWTKIKGQSILNLGRYCLYSILRTFFFTDLKRGTLVYLTCIIRSIYILHLTVYLYSTYSTFISMISVDLGLNFMVKSGHILSLQVLTAQNFVHWRKGLLLKIEVTWSKVKG
jgi:hypothetical protein